MRGKGGGRKIGSGQGARLKIWAWAFEALMLPCEEIGSREASMGESASGAGYSHYLGYEAHTACVDDSTLIFVQTCRTMARFISRGAQRSLCKANREADVRASERVVKVGKADDTLGSFAYQAMLIPLRER